MQDDNNDNIADYIKVHVDKNRSPQKISIVFPEADNINYECPTEWPSSLNSDPENTFMKYANGDELMSRMNVLKHHYFNLCNIVVKTAPCSQKNECIFEFPKCMVKINKIDFHNSNVMQKLFRERINKCQNNVIYFIKSIQFRIIDSPVMDCGGVQREALTCFGDNAMECHYQIHKECFEVNEKQHHAVKKDHTPDAHGDQTIMINFCYELLCFLFLAGEFPKGLDPFFAMSLFNANNTITRDEFWYK